MSRAPPAASWPVAADRWAQGLAGAIWAAAGAALAAVVSDRLELAPVAATTLAVLLAVPLAMLAWRRARQPHGRLAWSGASWMWLPAPDDAEPAARSPRDSQEPSTLDPPRVMLDLDGWLLLRCHAAGGGAARWLSVHRDALPGAGEADGAAAWAAFRAAVYSPATRTDSRPRAPGDTSS